MNKKLWSFMMFSKFYYILYIMKKFLILFMKDEKEIFLCYELWVVLYYIVGYCLFIDFYELDFGNYICKVLSEIGEIL